MDMRHNSIVATAATQYTRRAKNSKQTDLRVWAASTVQSIFWMDMLFLASARSTGVNSWRITKGQHETCGETEVGVKRLICRWTLIKLVTRVQRQSAWDGWSSGGLPYDDPPLIGNILLLGVRDLSFCHASSALCCIEVA